jgi:hypothetical protein
LHIWYYNPVPRVWDFPRVLKVVLVMLKATRAITLHAISESEPIAAVAAPPGPAPPGLALSGRAGAEQVACADPIGPDQVNGNTSRSWALARVRMRHKMRWGRRRRHHRKDLPPPPFDGGSAQGPRVFARGPVAITSRRG